ncbi:MAG: hypothetical protein ACJA2Q_000162 [Pseudohongiellaceae bacterium]|jgi:hypothetical protein
MMSLKNLNLETDFCRINLPPTLPFIAHLAARSRPVTNLPTLEELPDLARPLALQINKSHGDFYGDVLKF